MIEDIVYKIVDNAMKQYNNQGVDNAEIKNNMNINLKNYLEDLKVEDVKRFNYKKSSELDILMYLIYLQEKQKREYIKALDNIKEIIDFKVSTHKDTLTTSEIDSLIDMYKIQIKLK